MRFSDCLAADRTDQAARGAAVGGAEAVGVAADLTAVTTVARTVHGAAAARMAAMVAAARMARGAVAVDMHTPRVAIMLAAYVDAKSTVPSSGAARQFAKRLWPGLFRF